MPLKNTKMLHTKNGHGALQIGGAWSSSPVKVVANSRWPAGEHIVFTGVIILPTQTMH